mmetsp:Transcript_31226/g.82778  ORF Transcript_31226/g.82778 Transcript_31226/m.82778 type:complete len:245 (+) Transcript_31226:1294-2028(+)
MMTWLAATGTVMSMFTATPMRCFLATQAARSAMARSCSSSQVSASSRARLSVTQNARVEMKRLAMTQRSEQMLMTRPAASRLCKVKTFESSLFPKTLYRTTPLTTDRTVRQQFVLMSPRWMLAPRFLREALSKRRTLSQISASFQRKVNHCTVRQTSQSMTLAPWVESGHSLLGHVPIAVVSAATHQFDSMCHLAKAMCFESRHQRSSATPTKSAISASMTVSKLTTTHVDTPRHSQPTRVPTS